MAIELPPLPYAMDGLAPHISARTLEFHYGKHHYTYVTNLNALIADTRWADTPLEDIIKQADGGVFNNAAQVWNHTFYWNCLSPQGGGEPKDKTAAALAQSFSSLDEFKTLFTTKAVTLFGSGWAWLVKDSRGQLKIVQTSNAGTPLTDTGMTPLLTCDVWEHAYYLDYQNARFKYLDAFWQLVDWTKVEDRLGS